MIEGMAESKEKLPRIKAPPTPPKPPPLPFMEDWDFDKFKRIIVEGSHDSLDEAVAADLFDVVPVAGDVGNLLRIFNVRDKKELTPEQQKFIDNVRDKAQSIDLIAGSIPGAGAGWDLFTPTNTIIFLIEKYHIDDAMKFVGMKK